MGTRHWVLIRSVAKAYGPDLRIAAFTGDAETVDRVLGRQRLGPGWVSRLLQGTVAHLWATEAVDPAVVARSYGKRRDGLVRALARRGVEAHGRSGMNVWVPVADETGAVTGLLASGWAVAPGARFRMDTGLGRPAHRLRSRRRGRRAARRCRGTGGGSGGGAELRVAAGRCGGGDLVGPSRPPPWPGRVRLPGRTRADTRLPWYDGRLGRAPVIPGLWRWADPVVSRPRPRRRTLPGARAGSWACAGTCGSG